MKYLVFFVLTLSSNAFLVNAILAQKQPVDYVNPFVGTGGHGHTFPGATVPFGMVQLSPDTRTEGWDAAGGYHYSDSTILGFSHTHLNGTGINDFCDVLLTPSVSGSFEPLKFQHQNEVAQAGYFKTFLDENHIKVELTSSERVGFHRYIFPKDVSTVTFFLHINKRNKTHNSWVINPRSNRLEGHIEQSAWAKNRYLAFVLESDAPATTFGLVFRENENKAQRDTFYRVQYDISQKHELLIKVALSPVSEANAWANMQTEVPHWDFDKVRQDAIAKWEKYLNRVQIEGGSDEQRTIFYTALYHTLIHPSVWQDVNGDYRGLDNKVYRSNSFVYHSIFSLWDTYRALHPLYTIICPEKLPDFINGFIDDFEKTSHLPMWNFPGNETWCMIGNHSIPVIADAYLKGIKGFDAEKALNAMVKTVNRDTFGLKSYREKGYIPADTEGESVSKILEYAYDDYCIATMAKAMGKKDIYDTFIQRSQNWKNIFNPKTRFFQAKANETYLEPFDPREVNHHFTEGNAWQYAFAVQHDIEGLILMLGGKEKFEAKLDEFFNSESKTTGRDQVDITGLIGQYAHGNEPSHHMAYLYNFVGKPEKTQHLIRQIMNNFYKNAPDGLIGNEDCGQMSAWFVLSSMGAYPINPCHSNMEAGVRLFNKITIQNGKGVYTSDNFSSSGKWLNGLHTSPPLPYQKPEKNIVAVPFVAKGNKLFKDKQSIELACADKSAEIYYTTDGSDPVLSGKKYITPVVISEPKTIKFCAKMGDRYSKVANAVFKKSIKDKSITLKNKPAPHYTAGSDDALVDGEFGISQWQLGGWQGFEGIDMEAVIDLKKIKNVKTITLNCVEDQNAWIFPPSEVLFYTSLDGKKYQQVSVQKPHLKPDTEGAHIRPIIGKTKGNIRYIKVVAKPINPIPTWHKGSGGKGWIFADEIMVE